MKKMIPFLCAGLLLSFFNVSCKSTSSKELIVGKWIPATSGKDDLPKMKVKFLANKTGVAEFEGQTPSPSDTVKYEIKNEGKTLVTTENSGRVEEMEILELNDKKLTLLSKERKDTLRFTRE